MKRSNYLTILNENNYELELIFLEFKSDLIFALETIKKIEEGKGISTKALKKFKSKLRKLSKHSNGLIKVINEILLNIETNENSLRH